MPVTKVEPHLVPLVSSTSNVYQCRRIRGLPHVKAVGGAQKHCPWSPPRSCRMRWGTIAWFLSPSSLGSLVSTVLPMGTRPLSPHQENPNVNYSSSRGNPMDGLDTLFVQPARLCSWSWDTEPTPQTLSRC